MIKKLLLVLVAFLAGFIVIVATRPSDFRITRSAVMAAPPEAVFAQVNDFHKWDAWSPWAKLDPNAKNSFEGAPAGVGAIMRWDGNNDVGKGSMEILESRNDLIRIKLDFIKPFEAVNHVEFAFVPKEGGTDVTWSMTGRNSFVGKAMDLFMNMDQMVGGMFEKGLASLKAIVEASPQP